MALPKWLDEPVDRFYAKYLDRPVRRLRFYVSETESPRLPESFDGLRVMHLSDMHAKDYGKNGCRLVRACALHKPDIIVFTGDIFSRNESMERIMTRVPMMKALTRLAPVYYITGNHEGDTPQRTAALCRAMSEAGVQVLRNDSARLTRGGEHINIYGLELPPECYHDEWGGYRHLRRLTVGDIDKRLGRPEAEEFNLLLAHTPIKYLEYADWCADLTMSGHVRRRGEDIRDRAALAGAEILPQIHKGHLPPADRPRRVGDGSIGGAGEIQDKQPRIGADMHINEAKE